MEVNMEHVENLTKDSKDLDVIVKGRVTGKLFSSSGEETLYQIITDQLDNFEVDERCVYYDVTQPVEVDKYVADWYEEHKDNFELNLFRAIDLIPEIYREGELSEFENG